MSSSNLIRLCGLALLFSGVLFVISNLFGVYVNLDPRAPFAIYVFTGALTLAAAPLEVLGLLGLYARRPESMGLFGLIAFLVAFFGAILVTGVYWYNTFVAPSIVLMSVQLYELLQFDRPGPYAFGPVLSYQLFSLGWLLFGVALLRERLYPRPGIILLISSSLLLAVSSILSEFLAGPSSAGSVLAYASAAISALFSAVLAWLGFALWRGTGVSEGPSA